MFEIGNRIVGQAVLKRFVHLASWIIVSFGLEKLAAVLTAFILARTIGIEEFGRLSLSQSLVTALQVFSVMGTGSVISRYVPSERAKGFPSAISIINMCLTITFVTCLSIYAVSLLLPRDLYANNIGVEKHDIFKVFLWMLFISMSGLISVGMIALEKGKVIATVSMVYSMTSLILIPLLARKNGFDGAVIGYIILEFVKLSALGLASTKVGRREGAENVMYGFGGRQLKMVARFGFPALMTSIVYPATVAFAQILLGRLSQNGLADVGVFSLSNSVFGAVLLVSTLTNGAAMPILSSQRDLGDLRIVKRSSLALAGFQVTVSILVAIPLAILTPTIASHAGSVFAGAYPVFLIMIAAGVVVAGQTALGNYLLVMDRPFRIFVTILPWSAVVVLVTVWLAPTCGPYALAIAMLVGAIIRTTLVGILWLRT